MGVMDGDELLLLIKIESDIMNVRKTVRQIACECGFGLTDVTRIVTAASELARNIYRYGKSGSMTCRYITETGKNGLEMVFKDDGPGIENIELAMSEGYSSSGSLGMGLPGTRRLMDSMVMESEPGSGVQVTVIKWLNR